MADNGNVALVTGGTEPVGESIARELLRRQWTVVLQGAEEAELDEARTRLAEAAEDGRRVAVFPADTSRQAEREQLVEFLLDEFGRIDLLVASADGPGVNENLLEMAEGDYERVMSACVTSTVFLSQLVANEMARLAESGEVEAARIVLINSICAYTSATERSARCIAAAATSMLRQLLADELAVHGISVYEIRTGLISTGGGDPVHARYDQLIEEGLTPIRRWGRPQDVALAVAAIAEDLLPYSTGEVINVDGGFHLRRL
ncbi:MAG TPA: SDR family oxidoreductase [Phycisphaerae bacterium]|nr:SDR family oxidoreductase [Phycisphaerae bacterium]